VQVNQKTGGVFLLQQMQPTTLVGSLISGIDTGNHGWVQLSFYPTPGVFALAETETSKVATLSRAIALALIAVLLVVIAQIKWLSSADTIPTVTTSNPCALLVRVERDAVSFTWDKASSQDIAVMTTDDQINLRMSEQFARQLAAELIDALGRFSAMQPRSQM
jgi:hypothetical protein